MVKQQSILPRIAAAFAVLAAILCGSAVPAADRDSELFNAGSMRLSVMFGNATAFQQSYSVAGMGFGYYVIDRLEAGIEAETWSGNTPNISRMTPQLQYVFPLEGNIKPYAGALYTRTFIQGRDGTNTAGVRAGVIFLTGSRLYLGIGLVHEIQLNCDRTVYDACSNTYPDLFLAVLF